MQAAALLGCLEGMVAAASGQVESRAPLLGLLDEVAARELEVDWLATYEADEGRYTVRPGQHHQQHHHPSLESGAKKPRLHID